MNAVSMLAVLLAGLSPAQTDGESNVERTGTIAPSDVPVSPQPAADAGASAEPADEASADAGPVRLLILDIHADAEEQKAAELLSNLLAEAVSQANGVEVNTSADLRRLMALEAEKAVMGCDEESCLGEIAGAFGVPFIVFGKLNTLADTTTLSLSLFDADEARPVWRDNLQARRAEDLQYEVAGAAEGLLTELAKHRPAVTFSTIESPQPLRAELPWVMISGFSVAGAGAALMLAAAGGSWFLSDLVLPSAPDVGRTVVYWSAAGAAALAVVALGVVVVGVGVGAVGLVRE